MATIHPLASTQHADNQPPTPEDLIQSLMEQARALVCFVRSTGCDGDEVMTFSAFERAFIPKVFDLARTAVALFLTCCEAREHARTPTRMVRGGHSFQRTRARARTITTWFGPVRYWRHYMLEIGTKAGHGFFPLDVALGLVSDRFSLSVLAVVVRLATKLSFAEAKATAELFLPAVPSTEVIEQATLGLGHFTSEWFEIAPAPRDDGDVLVILVDSKGVPTATERELERRRGSRKGRPKAPSPRHRGRNRRGRYESKPRRKKGDKTKNARMATVVVMYTLRSEGTLLLGPINKWVYASFAPKRHAFDIARREADKRGFSRNSGHVVQIVTDGDLVLEQYAKELFPEAAYHTLDVMHVIEKLWEAGECVLREGSDELFAWMESQKELLYAGRINELLTELRRLRRRLGRGTKTRKRRERMLEIIEYLAKRKWMMCYADLVDEDLEIGSGAVEGAVKHVMGKRCDQGGMRWIRERAEAVVQLRCIELNGDWDRFIAFVHDRVRQRGQELGVRVRLQQCEPAPLPEIEEAA